MTDIDKFINHFHSIVEDDNITDVFTCGCCYWFAFILCERFNATIMYDPVMNHFAARIDGRLYDITGDVTDKFKMIEWQKFDDELEKQRIIGYCINFDRE